MLATNLEQANPVTLQGMAEVDSERPCKTLESNKACVQGYPPRTLEAKARELEVRLSPDYKTLFQQNTSGI